MFDAAAAAANWPKLKGKMVISVNDIPEMRQAFAGLHMESVDITYTVGGGKKGSKTAELVIRNW